MPNPVAGRQYTVVEGDTLSDIAGRAYGDQNEWPRIFSANQSALKSKTPDLIFPGEVLNIPVLPEIENIKSRFFQSRGVTDGVELKIEDRILPVQSASVTRTMDTAADGWTAVFAWQPGLDKEIDKLTNPYFYPKASISLDGKLMVSGHLYRVKPESDNKGRSKQLFGFSRTIDAVDSHMKPPYESSNVTLPQRCKQLLTPLGIGLKIDPNADTGGQFNRVKSSRTETVWNHLSSLAKQRNVLLTSTPAGEMLITVANLLSPVDLVGTIEEGVSFVDNFSADFDGRKRFNIYRAVSQGAAKTDQKVGIAKDDLVPLARFLTFNVDDSLKGEMNQAAAWRRNQETAKALKLPVPVDTWYAPNGKLWAENTRVTIKSVTWGIPDGFTFLIRQVDFSWNTAGKAAVLHVLPTSYYSGGDLQSPW